jgi:hypothetical protein
MTNKAIEPFHFDGHGVNDAEGRRLAKLTQQSAAFEYAELEHVGELLSRAPEMRDALLECAAWLRELDLREDEPYTKTLELLDRIESLTSPTH